MTTVEEAEQLNEVEEDQAKFKIVRSGSERWRNTIYA